MLKIKDSVDLKELEKFGFEEDINGFIYKRYNGYKLWYEVYVEPINRAIRIQTYSVLFIAKRLQCLLFDLIKANLVEKVEEV